jgi:GH18 family chitinase
MSSVNIRSCWLHRTGAKGNYINNAGLAGFAMWEAGGDSNNILLDAISLGSGIGC